MKKAVTRAVTLVHTQTNENYQNLETQVSDNQGCNSLSSGNKGVGDIQKPDSLYPETRDILVE
jgi:hypothetical protein